MEHSKWYGVVELIVGLLFLAVAVLTFIWPQRALAGFVFLYGLIAITSGIAGIAFYISLEKRVGYGPAAALGIAILNIVLGLILVINTGAGMLALTIIFPIWFILLCISRLCNLSFIRLFAGKAEYWVMLISNCLGIILGLVLLFFPTVSGTVFAYIIALFLIILSFDMLVFAFGHFRKRL